MPLPKSLTTVTTLSKTLAMILFIALPFVGFSLGMRYQQMQDLYEQQLTQSQPLIAYKPTPTADQTENWKTYTNTNPSFQIQYPATGVEATNLNMNNPTIVLELIYYAPSKLNTKNVLGGRDLIDGYFIKIDWEDSIQAETLEKAANETLTFYKRQITEPATFTNLEKTMLNDNQAYKLDTETKSYTTTTYIVSNGNKIVRINLNALGDQNDRLSYMKTMKQILSTFKFL